MPLYKGIGPDGFEYEISGPEGLSQEFVDAEIARYVTSVSDTDEVESGLSTEDQALIDAMFPEDMAEDEEAGFFENVGTGLLSGAAGLYESAALGVATALDEENELEARRIIQETADALTPEGGDKESITYQVAQGVGSILGLAPTALLGFAAIPVGGAIAMSAGAGEASERAREEGATEEERGSAALLGTAVGATEILPLGRVFSAFKLPFLQDLTQKIGPDAVADGGSRIANAAATGGVEAAQEATAEFLQNAIERGYNPDQELIEGLDEAAGIGGASGAIVDLLVNAFVKKGRNNQFQPSDEMEQLGLFTEEEAPVPELDPTRPLTREGEQGELFGAPPMEEPAEQPQGEQLDLFGAERKSSLENEEAQLAEYTDVFYSEFPEALDGQEPLAIEEIDQAVRELSDQGMEIQADSIGRELVKERVIQNRGEQPAKPKQPQQTELFDGQAPSADVVPRIERKTEQQMFKEGDFEGIAQARTSALQQEQRRTEAEEAGRRDKRLKALDYKRKKEEAQIALTLPEIAPVPEIGEEAITPETTEVTAEAVEAPVAEAPAKKPTKKKVKAPATTETGQIELLDVVPATPTTQEVVTNIRAKKQKQAQPQPRVVDDTMLIDMGLPEKAPVRERITGKDLAVPEDATVVRNELTTFVANPKVTPEIKTKVTTFLDTNLPEIPVAEEVQVGTETTTEAKPKGRRGSVQDRGRPDEQAAGADTTTVTPTEQEGLADVERDATPTPARKGRKPTALEGTDDTLAKADKTKFAPAEDATLVDRRDVADPKPTERQEPTISGGAREGDITTPEVVSERFESIDYTGAKPEVAENITELLRAEYGDTLNNVQLVTDTTKWNGAHFNGGVAINWKNRQPDYVAYVVAHELGHASHSLLGDKVNKAPAIKKELKAIENYIYPKLREQVAKAESEGKNVDAEFFNYLLSPEELLAEFNVYRLSDPAKAKKVAPTIDKLFAGVSKDKNLIKPRSAFPNGFIGVSKSRGNVDADTFEVILKDADKLTKEDMREGLMQFAFEETLKNTIPVDVKKAEKLFNKGFLPDYKEHYTQMDLARQFLLEGDPKKAIEYATKAKKYLDANKLPFLAGQAQKVIDSAKEAQAQAKVKPEAPGPAESTTSVKEVSEKPKTEALPQPQVRTTEAERTAMRIASMADQKLRQAQEDNVELVGNPIFEYVFAKVGNKRATDDDKLKVAELLTKTKPPKQSKRSSKTPNNAARIYFGKHSTPESSIEVIAHDIIFGGEGQSAYQKVSDADLTPEQRAELGTFAQFKDESSAFEDAYMESMLNKDTAEAAKTWVLAHLSPELKKLMAERIEYYTDMQTGLNTKEWNESYRATPNRKKALKRLERMRKKALRDMDYIELNQAEAAAYGIKPSEKLLSDAEIEKAVRDIQRSERAVEATDMRGLELDAADRIFLDTLLPADAISASTLPVHPAVEAAMNTGSMAKVLQVLAATNPDTSIQNAARKLIKYIGLTKVNLVEALGPNESGKFSPSTNTISISAESGLNTHTILHESAHAVTSATLANKSHPVTKQLSQIYNNVKDKLGTAYGTQSLDEFVAEVFSNPEFRAQLALLPSKNGRFTAFEEVINSIGNFIRRILGMQTKPLGSALTEADALIEAILAPAPQSRFAEDMMLIQREGPEAVGNFFNRYADGVRDFTKAVTSSESTQDLADRTQEFLLNAKDTAIRGLFWVMPSQSFYVDTLGGYLGLSQARRLHELPNEMESEIFLVNKQLDMVLQKLNNWAESNKDNDQKRTFDNLVHQSTIERIDPTKTRGDYEGQETEYNALRDEYDKLDARGKVLYAELRDTYKKMYQRMHETINRRIDTLTDETTGEAISEADKKTLKDKIFGKLFEKGQIEPYFPLTRRGDFWLEYNVEVMGVDGQTTTERVSRAYESRGARQRAIALLNETPEVVKNPSTGNAIYETNDDKAKISFVGAPQTSFVGQTLKILDKNGVNDTVKREFIELFIDTLPEASFAKSLRKRENTLGFQEDATLAFRTKAYDLGRQTVRMEYTNKIRQQQRALEKEIDAEDSPYNGTTLATLIKYETEQRVNFVVNPPSDIFARLAQSANRLAFLGTIGFNVSSAIVNTAQLPMMVFPFMAGKTDIASATRNIKLGGKFFFGAGSESSMMVNGEESKTRNILRIPSMDNYYQIGEDGMLSVRTDRSYSTEKNIDFNNTKISKQELVELMLPLVQKAMDQGQLNHSLFFDTQGLEQSGKTKYAVEGAVSKLNNFLEAFNVVSATPFHTTERFNRQVALAGTYLNEVQRLSEKNRTLPASQQLSQSELLEEAANEAIYETQQTNGGAILATAPRIAQKNILRVAMMYKTFGIQMYYTQLKTGLKAIDGLLSEGKLTQEERRIARRQLIGSQLAIVSLSGIQGLTIYGIATMIANMFLDDDEPDAETMFREWLGNEGFYKGGVNAVAQALGADIDVATRIGMSNLIVAQNRYNFNDSMEKDLVQLFGGPFYGYTSQIIRGVDEIYSEDGNTRRGIENVLPAAFRNMAKSFRYAEEEGILTRRGNPIVEDLDASELTAVFFGFPPAEYTKAQELNSIRKGLDKATGDKRTSLLRRLYVSNYMGDDEGYDDAMEAILEYNDSPLGSQHPIDPDSIMSSMKKHAMTTATMVNGVTLNPKLRASLLEIGEDW